MSSEDIILVKECSQSGPEDAINHCYYSVHGWYSEIDKYGMRSDYNLICVWCNEPKSNQQNK